jgi:hypothetical protein
MRFEAEGPVRGAAPAQVYAILRDELPKLVPYLDNVAAIDELKRTPGAAGPQVLNRWRADPGQVPSVVRGLLKPEMLQWLDHAAWDDAGQHVDWRIEPAVFAGLYRCSGRNRVVEAPGGARIVISGELIVDAGAIPGVPRLLAGRVVPALESYLVERMRPNMASLGVGVERFLAAGG